MDRIVRSVKEQRMHMIGLPNSLFGRKGGKKEGGEDNNEREGGKEKTEKKEG